MHKWGCVDEYPGFIPKSHLACEAHSLICLRRWWSCINATTHPLASSVQSAKFKTANWENSPRLSGPHWAHTLMGLTEHRHMYTMYLNATGQSLAYSQGATWRILKDTKAPQGSSLRLGKIFTFGTPFSVNYSICLMIYAKVELLYVDLGL